MDLRVACFSGTAVTPYLADLARLRRDVFREYPYIYDASGAYEGDYLSAYARSPDSVFVLAWDGDRIVGAATGIPLLDDSEAFRQPFLTQGPAAEEVFYFGESVLLPPYRGRGLGHRFFDAREAHARSLQRFAFTAFCAVERAQDDPRRPADYRTHDVFWTKRGYRRQDDLQCTLDWLELGQAEPSGHTLRFWLRALEPNS